MLSADRFFWEHEDKHHSFFLLSSGNSQIICKVFQHPGTMCPHVTSRKLLHSFCLQEMPEDQNSFFFLFLSSYFSWKEEPAATRIVDGNLPDFIIKTCNDAVRGRSANKLQDEGQESSEEQHIHAKDGDKDGKNNTPWKIHATAASTRHTKRKVGH